MKKKPVSVQTFFFVLLTRSAFHYTKKTLLTSDRERKKSFKQPDSFEIQFHPLWMSTVSDSERCDEWVKHVVTVFQTLLAEADILSRRLFIISCQSASFPAAGMIARSSSAVSL